MGVFGDLYFKNLVGPGKDEMAGARQSDAGAASAAGAERRKHKGAKYCRQRPRRCSNCSRKFQEQAGLLQKAEEPTSKATRSKNHAMLQKQQMDNDIRLKIAQMDDAGEDRSRSHQCVKARTPDAGARGARRTPLDRQSAHAGELQRGEPPARVHEDHARASPRAAAVRAGASTEMQRDGADEGSRTPRWRSSSMCRRSSRDGGHPRSSRRHRLIDIQTERGTDVGREPNAKPKLKLDELNRGHHTGRPRRPLVPEKACDDLDHAGLRGVFSAHRGHGAEGVGEESVRGVRIYIHRRIRTISPTSVRRRVAPRPNIAPPAPK